MEHQADAIGWPFIPRYLTQFIAPIVLGAIEAGIAADKRMGLVIAESSDPARSVPHWITPSSSSHIGWRPFCQKLRELRGSDGACPGDAACRACDRGNAGAMLRENAAETRRWECHMGLWEAGTPLRVSGETVAVLVTGQALGKGDVENARGLLQIWLRDSGQSRHMEAAGLDQLLEPDAGGHKDINELVDLLKP